MAETTAAPAARAAITSGAVARFMPPMPTTGAGERAAISRTPGRPRAGAVSVLVGVE
jgi:hypothetical protein